MPGKNILEELQVQQRSWPNFGLFQQPYFLFSLSDIHTYKARPSQVFNSVLRLKESRSSDTFCPPRASPIAEEGSVLLNTETDIGQISRRLKLLFTLGLT